MIIRNVMGILLPLAFLLGQVPSTSPGKAAAEKKTSSEWRQSPFKLREELDRYQKNATAFPGASFDFLKRGGEVPSNWEVMRLYGGPIEWEGTFEGFEDKGNIDGRANRIKFASVGMMLFVYPSNSAIAQWQKVAMNSMVRYRGTIEGIAGFNPGFTSKTTGDPVKLMIVSVKDAVPVSAQSK